MKKCFCLILSFLISLLIFLGCEKVSDEQLAQEVVNSYAMDLYNVNSDDKFFEIGKKSSTIDIEKYDEDLEGYLSSYKQHFTEKAFLTFMLNRAIVPYRHENMTVKFKDIDYRDIKFDKEKNSITIDCKISFDSKILNMDKTTELKDRRIIVLIKESGYWKIISERVFYDQKLLDIKFSDQY